MKVKILISTILFLFIKVGSVFASSVVINEIMAKPDDETEWVELYNQTPDTIDLSSWKIRDGNTSSSDDLTLSGQIIAGGFLTFDHSKGWLNDSGNETVTLLNGDSTIDSYQYNGATQGKTFARIPDGENWLDNSTPTKNSTNGNPTPSPTPTSTPSPTSTPTPSPTPTSTSQFTISDIPSQINSDQSFSIKINLSLPSNPSTPYYLKGAFKIKDGTRYFGLTKNGNDWIEYGDDALDQIKITTDSSGNWSGNLEVKPDTFDKDYKGTGDYIFKILRLTSGGSSYPSNESNIKIIADPTPQPTTQTTPSPTKSATPKPTILSTLSPSPEPVPELSEEEKTATVAGVEIENVKLKGTLNLFSFAGITMIVAGVSILSYIFIKNSKLINLWKK